MEQSSTGTCVGYNMDTDESVNLLTLFEALKRCVTVHAFKCKKRPSVQEEKPI